MNIKFNSTPIGLATDLVDFPKTKEPPKKKPRRACSDVFPAFGGTDVACEVSGKSRATLHRWVAAGLIEPPRKLNGRTQNIWDIGKLIASLENDVAR
jgi:hypothetical protein